MNGRRARTLRRKARFKTQRPRHYVTIQGHRKPKKGDWEYGKLEWVEFSYDVLGPREPRAVYQLLKTPDGEKYLNEKSHDASRLHDQAGRTGKRTPL